MKPYVTNLKHINDNLASRSLTRTNPKQELRKYHLEMQRVVLMLRRLHSRESNLSQHVKEHDTPYQFFKFLFTDEFLKKITEETILYSSKNNSSKPKIPLFMTYKIFWALVFSIPFLLQVASVISGVMSLVIL